MAAGSRFTQVVALACSALVACVSELCDPVVPTTDEVVFDAGIPEVDFDELYVYPERYAERTVRVRAWLELGPAHTLIYTTGWQAIGVELTPEQEEWLLRFGYFTRYVTVVGIMTHPDSGGRFLRGLTEIAHADPPRRSDQ